MAKYISVNENKSDLNFINCVREVLGFDPLHQGESGSNHYLTRAKRARESFEEYQDSEAIELAEIEELIAFVA